MIYYLTQLHQENVEGLEALSLYDSFKLGFKNLSLDIDKKLSTFQNTVHIVDDLTISKLSGRNYLKENTTLIPIPAIWTPKAMPFKDYVNKVNSGVNLFTLFKTDLEEFYHWLKQIATKSKVPMTFSYRISNTKKLIDQQYEFIKSLKTTVHTEKVPLKTLYASYSDFINLIGVYNNQVKLLKPRDPEVVAKQITLNAQLADVTLKKIEAGDIRLSSEEIDKVKQVFKDFEHYSNVVAVSLGLINELPAVFESQITAITNK